jgi:histidinol dehydrogenase
MDAEKLMTQVEMDELVARVWLNAQTEILKQVEYAINSELSTRARSRAHVLIIREVDTILKPKIEAMKGVMEERAAAVVARVLPKLEEAMRESLEDAIRDIDEYTIRQVLGQVENRIRLSMVKALNQPAEPVPPA